MFWGKFVGSDQTHKIIRPGCGWAHYPPNAERDYDWGNKRYVETDIEDWKPDGTGRTQPLNCDRWAGDSLKWFVYWMQNIPDADTGLAYKGKPLNNWWVCAGGAGLLDAETGSVTSAHGNASVAHGTVPGSESGAGPFGRCGEVMAVEQAWMRGHRLDQGFSGGCTMKNARRGLRASFRRPTRPAGPTRGLPQPDVNLAGDGTLSCSADVFRFPSSLGGTEAQVVVAVPGFVVVAVRRPAVPRRVVPATAAIHAVRASFGQDPSMLSITRRRKYMLSARRTNASSGSTCRAVSSSVHRPLV